MAIDFPTLTGALKLIQLLYTYHFSIKMKYLILLVIVLKHVISSQDFIN